MRERIGGVLGRGKRGKSEGERESLLFVIQTYPRQCWVGQLVRYTLGKLCRLYTNLCYLKCFVTYRMGKNPNHL